jgi:hypothetical protein
MYAEYSPIFKKTGEYGKIGLQVNETGDEVTIGRQACKLYSTLCHGGIHLDTVRASVY